MSTTTMMALRITWFPLCRGENGRGMKGKVGRAEGGRERRGKGARGAKSGFKLRDNVVAPRRPQRAGWARAVCQTLPRFSSTWTDERTDHNVARRERQFTSRTDGAAPPQPEGRQCTHEHQVGGRRERGRREGDREREREREGDQLRY